ncbi:hypothetical protein [Spirillospora sp. NPDC047279]|uniref:hypothetical protein n=1 Tax=Spirillospora sp. NPDC047279 TaxID=3155478 RepID=UPI0034119011
MALQEWLVYEAVCDGCSDVHDAPDNFDENEALTRAEAAGWVRTEDEIHCPECVGKQVVA